MWGGRRRWAAHLMVPLWTPTRRPRAVVVDSECPEPTGLGRARENGLLPIGAASRPNLPQRLTDHPPNRRLLHQKCITKAIPFEAKPTIKPTIKCIIKPTIKPTIKPIIKPTIKPIIKLTIKPTLKPTIKLIIKLTIKPIIKPTINSTVKPTIKPHKQAMQSHGSPCTTAHHRTCRPAPMSHESAGPRRRFYL